MSLGIGIVLAVVGYIVWLGIYLYFNVFKENKEKKADKDKDELAKELSRLIIENGKLRLENNQMKLKQLELEKEQKDIQKKQDELFYKIILCSGFKKERFDLWND